MLSHIGRNKRLPIYGQTEGDLDVDLDAIGVLTRRKRQKWCSRPDWDSMARRFYAPVVDFTRLP